MLGVFEIVPPGNLLVLSLFSTAKSWGDASSGPQFPDAEVSLLAAQAEFSLKENAALLKEFLGV